ncbi:MAG TPA: MlaD family protein [Alphaproteobacteria bacterium]|nr:MlaD family protein [Alphaproteobacteria bacterium]
MSRKADPKLIGLFVVGAVALLIGLVIALGGGRLFATTKTYVMFFADDVNGLQVGGAVNFRGVRVGSVKDIVLAYDSDKREVAIPVYVTLDQSRVRVSGEGHLDDMTQLIERGLRAQLRNQSFVTGQMTVELDFNRAVPARILGLEPRYPEIPTVRSSFSEIRATFGDLVADIRKLPIEEMMTKFSATLINLDKLVIDMNTLVNTTNAAVGNLDQRTGQALSPVPEMLRSMDRAARDVSKLASDVNAQVPGVSQRLVGAIEQLNATLMQAEQAMGSVQSGFGDGSQLNYQASRALEDIREAATALRGLADYLQQNPNAILTGKPDR